MAKPEVTVRKAGDGWGVYVGGKNWDWYEFKNDAMRAKWALQGEVARGDITMRDVARARGRRKRKNPMKNKTLWILLIGGGIAAYLLLKKKEQPLPPVGAYVPAFDETYDDRYIPDYRYTGYGYWPPRGLYT
jgi:hypothetical protein